MACARVPLDEQQVTEAGPYGKEHTLPALVRYCTTCFNKDLFTLKIYSSALNKNLSFTDNNHCTVCKKISTQSGRRTAVLCLISPHQKMALLLSWRSFWSMPNSSQRTLIGYSHNLTTNSGVR